MLFGQVRPLPVMLGPVGIAGMFRRRGETQAARAAGRAGIPFCLSTVSLCSLKEVVAAAGSEHVWFQLYVIRDRAFMRDLLGTAQELGAKGVLLGRAWLFALAARGEAGVSQLLELIAREMKVAMTLTGAQRIADIGRGSLAND
jgi:isopentenyl diphosphate isomerase/L-lactate dehydrogenase-like FMN-dependent dehydrogenase